VLFPGARSDQGEEELRDLVAGPQGQMLVPVSDDSVADDHESIGEVPLGLQGNTIAVVGAPPPSSMTSVPTGPGTRARDGSRLAA
jgi:hypothetical protein